MTHDHGEPLTFHPTAPALDRRRVLALMAASLALASGACSRPPRERIHPWVQMPEARGDGQPLYYASAMVRDGHAQGVLIGTQEGRPIKIEGNPLHPSSVGATDVFAQASVLQLWDPDRSAAVMQRLGASAAQDRTGPLAASSWSAFESAWRAAAGPLQARQGDGLRILSGPVSSPTLRGQMDALLQRFPKARWHQHMPPADTAAQAGALAAFGRPVQCVLKLEHAQCVVSLAADPFSDGPGAVRQAADWAARRRKDEPCATFAAEVTSGLFGARADRRIALAPTAIDSLLLRVATRLLDPAAEVRANPATADFESRLLAAVQAAGPGALIVPGPSLSSASHALVHALHQKLGAVGRTIDLIAPPAAAPEAGTLAELVRDMNTGAVDTLLVLDANPVYESSGALGFAAALGKVRFSVHSGLYSDETGQACTWHLPLSHTYEQWSDALAHDGTATLIQPAIAPLYDSRSLHELLAMISADTERDGHALVQRQWRGRAGADFDAFWRDSLRRGVVPGSAPAPLKLSAAPPDLRAPPSPPAPALVAVFAPDPSTHDGRFANNGWLQELPRPFTKLTWDNALLIGPGTARSIGIRTGDLVRVTADQRHVDAPAWVLAAHAEDAVVLPLGYGRAQAGRVGNGVGFDAYRLMPSDGTTLAVQLQVLGRQHSFAVTQHTLDPSDREPARTIATGERIAQEAPRPTLYPEHRSPGHAWAMAIDLDSCIGCNACTIACQAENNIPVVGKEEVANGREMHWIRVDRYDSAELEGSIFQPVPCMHCENAPCELVCPVGATVHDSEGLNVQVYNRCIGTRFCSNNCPYKVRRFNFRQYSDEETESLKGQRNPNVTVRQRGVMEKCTYCLQRVARARQHSERTGVALADGDVVTACQSVCPTSAIQFGDLNDPASAVVRLRGSPRHYALLGHLNTRPRTTYLARVRPKDEP
ncbi:4Fe-4S dicluster domain-containing protein [Variovorax sp. PBL-H6]|uniref:4Fe-4S dicluster domain-containing protein n=1 Tax=Variovorax sp. PBL-H6 TaxID=434009 RepID=UPI001E4A2CE4|nr:4Fe-4S dicluster domain-containing protein [Variovorax sp. PBL-H6]